MYLLLLWIAPFSFGQTQSRGAQPILEPELINHLGVWNCILYGDPAAGDERVILNFGPDGSTRIARPRQNTQQPWMPLSRWQIDEVWLSFTDSRMQRTYNADLSRTALGGGWEASPLIGGWWCSEAEPEIASKALISPSGEPIYMTEPLIPEVLATPRYPRIAIREAKEGRAVVCFQVDSSGRVQDPHFIELTDRIFLAPTLDALMLSNYKGWSEDQNERNRPACRSFVYQLDQIY
ncbi:MAG: hypothetical protein CMM56_01365 [Rhodospirillaceae bacterium]|nr:hypothetical protein [Rhodospirillaceae bacterium]